MNLLEIVQRLARNVGLETPEQVVTSPRREWQEALEFANLACEELARRVDWGKLTVSQDWAGTGAATTYNYPTDFSRIIQGDGVRSGGSIVLPLSRPEWAALSANQSEGAPRFYLLEGNLLRFWPYMASGATAQTWYQSANWNAAGAAEWVSDTDTALIDDTMILKGLILRWRRQKGMDYADYEAEYEANIADLAGFDGNSRL